MPAYGSGCLQCIYHEWVVIRFEKIGEQLQVTNDNYEIRKEPWNNELI